MRRVVLISIITGVLGKYIARYLLKENPQLELMGYDLPKDVERIVAEGILDSDLDRVSEYHDESDVEAH